MYLSLKSKKDSAMNWRVKDNIRTYRWNAHLRFLFIAHWRCSRTGLSLSGARVCMVATQGLYTHQKQNLAFMNPFHVVVPLKIFLRDCVDRESSSKFLLKPWVGTSAHLACNFCWIGTYLHCRKKLKPTANNQSIILYFKRRSEEEKPLFPLS